ncbi:hypothetical protein EON67_01625, partial [archaeon]
MQKEVRVLSAPETLDGVDLQAAMCTAASRVYYTASVVQPSQLSRTCVLAQCGRDQDIVYTLACRRTCALRGLRCTPPRARMLCRIVRAPPRRHETTKRAGLLV